MQGADHVPSANRRYVRLCAASLIIAASAGCNAPEPPPGIGEHPGVIDYRQPYTFDGDSKVNRLLIAVESRMVVRKGSRTRRYLMLSPHPRETTFEEPATPYRVMLERSGGASEITFIHSLDDGLSIVSRRYENLAAAPLDLLHECRVSNHTDMQQPAELDRKQVYALTSTENIVAAAQARRPIVGRLDYRLGGDVSVSVDFPIHLVNIKPSSMRLFSQTETPEWQAVSARVPLLTGDPADICPGTRPTIFAFRSFTGHHSAVQLCVRSSLPIRTQDFSCPVEVDGTLHLYAVVDAREKP